jgi:hypothetical protein
MYRDRLYRSNRIWKIDRYVNPSTGALQVMTTENAIVTGNPYGYPSGEMTYTITEIAPITEYTYVTNFRGAYDRMIALTISENSTTKVENLNADLLDGFTSENFTRDSIVYSIALG